VKRVIPVRMKAISSQIQVSDFFIGHDGSRFVFTRVEQRLHLESAVRARAADQRDHGLVIHQGLAAPVDADEGKEPVFDLVPLTGSRRIMRDADGDAHLNGEALKMHFPRTQPMAVAAACVSTNQQTLGVRITLAAQQPPPAPDAFHGELSSVVTHTDIHNGLVAGDVVGALEDGLALSQMREIVRDDRLRFAARNPRFGCSRSCDGSGSPLRGRSFQASFAQLTGASV
jgi:hypothetical protein